MQISLDLTQDLPVIANRVPVTLAQKEQKAIEVIQSHLKSDWSLVVASSFGKDSSVLLYLTLKAMKQLHDNQASLKTVYVMHSDTGYENPAMKQYADGEIEKLRDYAAIHDLPLKVMISSPNLSNDYFVQLIGGRTIATFADNDRKCQQMLKANPLNKLKRLIEKDIAETSLVKTPRVCVMAGTRFDESANRQTRMNERGDNDSFPVWNETSRQWTLSPIANFTTDDVFEIIGRVRSHQEHTYSDFEDLVRVYRDSAAGECMVNLYASGRVQKQTSCGSRHGCYICLAVRNDQSMENFLANDDYAYMKPLHQLREYIASRHYDWSSRNWLARSIDKEGQIAIKPNSYSPDFCLQLLRYTLTIDAREQEWAQAHQTVPRFQILSYPKILCIDALWNRYAYQRTLQACQTYKEIFIDGKRYDFPESFTYAAKEALPKDIKVPFTDDEFWSPGHGLYDADLALADPDANCGDLVNLDDEFIIDEEGADLFFQFELERALDFYHHGDAASFPASGLHYLMRLGVIQIFKNGINDWDMMLRIGNQLTRHQLRPILNQPEELIKRLT